MSKNSDALLSLSSDSSVSEKEIDDAIQCFQVAMQEQKERMEQVFQKTFAALQPLKEISLEMRRQQEVTKKIKESNLFARMNVMDKFRKEPKKSVQQQDNLTKPYIPPALCVVVKENKWYVK